MTISRILYKITKSAATLFHVLLLLSYGVIVGLPTTTNSNTQPAGVLLLTGIFGLVAIWSAPEKRKARWTATILNGLVFLVSLVYYLLIAPIVAFSLALILGTNIFVIWKTKNPPK